LALKNYDLIITDSEASKRDIISILKIKSEKLRVVYPCLPKVFGMKHPVSSMKNTKYCLYVGDATWNKNLVNLARAIKIANVTCVFVGKVFQTSAVEERSGKTAEVNNGWQKEFKNFVNETKDDKRFIFAGFVPDSELIKLYQQASFNILSSRDEGFGFSYLEAANFGCPSLLSNIPVLREISAGNALYIDPKEPEKMAEKIIEINSDKIGRTKIADSAKKGSEYFSAEKFRKEFLSAIK
jgi:glycosyltransferase involved in cell wall biosynthesis